MSTTPLNLLVCSLRQAVAVHQLDVLSDAELLEQYRSHRDPAAFEAVVRRHADRVFAACSKVLADPADVEDAFQATFLVLLQNARAVRNQQALGSFLYGVAHRIALQARARSLRRARAEARLSPAGEESPDLSWRETCAILHEELDRLPERYRLPLVLCYLDGKSRDEAAQELGWRTGVLRGRLERGRDRLRDRLTRRGVTLSAGLLAALANTATACSPSVPLIQATVHAASAVPWPTRISLLVRSVSEPVLGKFKQVAVTVLVVGLFSGLGLFAAGHWSGRPTPQPLLAAAVLGREVAPAQVEKDQEKAAVDVRGQVVDPDGKPLPGARLFTIRLKKAVPRSDKDVGAALAGTTAADGTFRVELPRSSFLRGRSYLVAHAAGFGVDFLEVQEEEPPVNPVTLKLVKDQPISGRLLDTEGKPLVGITVHPGAIYVPAEEKLDNYLNGWRQNWRDTAASPPKRLYLSLEDITGAATTDREGRFQLSGAGAERIVHVAIEGRGIARTIGHVITRAGFDPRSCNEAALAQMRPEARIKGQLPILYGPSFTFVAESSRAAEGVVRDRLTGRPLAGFQVWASFGFGNGARAVTDKDGKYRLEGLPLEKTYRVHVTPPDGNPYLRGSAEAEGTPGTGPVRIDIELAKGIVVTGQVIDQKTGKGVEAGIRFAPLPDNPYFGKPGFDGYRRDRTMAPTDKEGRFRIVTIPGKSVLMVQVHSRETLNGQVLCPYRRAQPDPDHKGLFQKDGDSWYFTAAGGGVDFLSTENVIKVVDLKPDGGPVRLELDVERGKTAEIAVQDANGQPLSGVTVSGLTEHWPITFKLLRPAATVYALDPAQPRRLVFLHVEKQLGGTAIVRGDEKEPVAVRLAPLGKVKGQFVDAEGVPLAGATVMLTCPDQVSSELYREVRRTLPEVKTDREGRFMLTDVVPGIKFSVQTNQGRTYFVGEPRIGLRQVEAGQTLDLGARKMKPSN